MIVDIFGGVVYKVSMEKVENDCLDVFVICLLKVDVVWNQVFVNEVKVDVSFDFVDDVGLFIQVCFMGMFGDE